MKKVFNILSLFIIISPSIFSQDEKLSNELFQSLKKNIFETWYPKTIDTLHGGFLTDFNFEWKAEGQQNKMLVSQTRHLWTLSKAAQFFNDEKYLNIAKHGFDFLKNKMWDSKYGGFYFYRDQKGNEIQQIGNNKTTYSNAFAIYCLSAYYKISKDTSALNFAIKTFNWLEKYAHDPINKGYFDLLNQDGSQQKLFTEKKDLQYFVKPKWKDQNSSIHLLEALTELYSAWKNDLLKLRLEEMLYLIRDRLVTQTGYLNLYFDEKWNPISFRDSIDDVRNANSYLDHVSFGHDVETAYLMLEAEEILENLDKSKTLSVAKKMVDHAIKYGWDNDNGGFYYEGYYFKNENKPKIINPKKVWWVQAEGLNSFLLMYKLFPDKKKYYELFLKQWEYIEKYLIDHKHGDWYAEGLDISPDNIYFPKSYEWKVNYHNSRALMNCIKMLDD
ncbi:MAG: AGE family epimerase/isomerase [Ignavibacteriae bacterium]|nr:AGE family epimerase/isomerase [Ignavibacteriota bacterium]